MTSISANQVPAGNRIESRQEKELRINSLALSAKISPLLGKFYSTPDLTSDSITANLSQVNIRRLNGAYNKLRTEKPLDDKEKQILTGVVRGMLILNFKPLQTFLGDAKYQSFLTIIAQSFIGTYGNSFKVPEIKAPVEVDDSLKPEDSDSSADSEEEDADSSTTSEGDTGETEAEEEDEGDEEEDEGDEDEDGEGDEDLESTSAAPNVIRYTDASTFITYDLIAFLRLMQWDSICVSLVKMREVEGFSSESGTRRITFRKARKIKHLSEDLCYLYEVVVNGEACGLIHSTEETGNSPTRRMWRVSLRDKFHDANYRTGFNTTEPYTIVNSRGRLVLHNLSLMTQAEARAWVKTAVEV